MQVAHTGIPLMVTLNEIAL